MPTAPRNTNASTRLYPKAQVPQPRKIRPQDAPHLWVAAAQIALDPRVAARAVRYGSFLAAEQTRIHALDVYCSGCRRNYEDVHGTPCAQRIDNRHLIGGDQSTRAKRKVSPVPDGVTVVPGPRIRRRGLDAVIRGEL